MLGMIYSEIEAGCCVPIPKRLAQHSHYWSNRARSQWRSDEMFPAKYRALELDKPPIRLLEWGKLTAFWTCQREEALYRRHTV